MDLKVVDIKQERVTPPRYQDNVVCSRQVQADCGNIGVEQEYCGWGVILEAIQCLPLLDHIHARFNVAELEVQLRHDRLDVGQSGCVL